MNLLIASTSVLDSFAQMVSVLLIFLFVLAITYIATKFIAGYQKNANMHNKNIQVVETFKLTNNKYIQILKTGEIYLVIAICKDSVTMLTKLDKEQLTCLDTTMDEKGIVPNFEFNEILDKIKNLKPQKRQDDELDEENIREK